MGNAFVDKGSTVSIVSTTPSSTIDIKAIIIEDYDVEVGEGTANTITASDGSQYNFVGDQGDNLLSFPVIITDDTLTAMLTSVYGAGTTVGTKTTWSLTNPGEVLNTITITPPDTSDDTAMEIIANEAKGVVFRPLFRLTGGWQGTLSYIARDFDMSYDSDTTD